MYRRHAHAKGQRSPVTFLPYAGHHGAKPRVVSGGRCAVTRMRMWEALGRTVEVSVSSLLPVPAGIGIGRITANFESSQLDGALRCSDSEAIDMCYYLLQHEGVCLCIKTKARVVEHRRVQRDTAAHPFPFYLPSLVKIILQASLLGRRRR